VPFVERVEVRVHYEVGGEGPPVVLLPGAGCDGSFWREAGYLDELAGEYRCVALDPRGFGRSSRPSDPEALRPEEQAADVLAVAEALELDRFALWGQSAGCIVAFTLGAAYPSRVTAIVASGGCPQFDEREWSEGCDGLRELAAAFRAAGTWKELIEGIAAREGVALPAGVAATNSDVEIGARLVERLLGERHHPEWLRLEPPCLFLLGELETDPGWPEKVKSALPQAQLVVLPGLGHLGGILAKELTMMYVRPFLARTAATA
jgi:pimeloyl-ACP methyl ester carboxylesterase